MTHDSTRDAREPDFLERGDNVRCVASGSDPTHQPSAPNLGFARPHPRKSVRLTLAAILNDCFGARPCPRRNAPCATDTSAQALTIDELGYLPATSAPPIYFSTSSAQARDQVRRDSRRTCLSSSGHRVPAQPALRYRDRLVQHCHVIDIDAGLRRPEIQSSPPKKAKLTASIRWLNFPRFLMASKDGRLWTGTSASRQRSAPRARCQ